MFTLVKEKNGFFRVKRGQSAEEVESALKTPVTGKAFAGRIIEVKNNLELYVAQVGDCYRTIAEKTGADEDALRELNGGKPVYPTCRIFVPLRKK